MAARNFGDSRLEVDEGDFGVVFIEEKHRSPHGRWVMPGGVQKYVAIPLDALPWVIEELEKHKRKMGDR